MDDAGTFHVVEAPVMPATDGNVEGAAPGDIADGCVNSLAPAHLRAEILGWWIFVMIVGAVLTGVIAIVWNAAPRTTGVLGPCVAGAVVIMAATVWGALRMPHLAHARTTYVVTPLGLEIRSGVFWRNVTNVPRSRIQHTDVTQGPILRRFGLAALTLYTAGTHQSSVTLTGVTHETALRLRDYLIRSEQGEIADGV